MNLIFWCVSHFQSGNKQLYIEMSWTARGRRLREALYKTRTDHVVFTDSVQNRTLSNSPQSKSVVGQRPSRFSEARRRTWHPENIWSVICLFFFFLVFFFNVRITQLIYCHLARLISLQGLAENINNVYFISPLEELVLDISKTYVSSRQRGENKKIILSCLSCAALWKKKKKTFISDRYFQTVSVVFGIYFSSYWTSLQ